MAKKNDNSNDLSARLAALDEEFGITPTPQEEPQPQPKVEKPSKKAEKKSKKEPVVNNGISHSFESEEETPVSPPIKKQKEKKSLFGFGKKKKDSQKETDLAMEKIAEEFDVPKELIYNGPNKKRMFGRKKQAPSEGEQVPVPVPVPVPVHNSYEEEELEENEFSEREHHNEHVEETVHYEDLPKEKDESEENFIAPPIEEEFKQDNSIRPSIVKNDDEEEIRPPYLGEEEDDNSIRPSIVNDNLEDEEDFRPPYVEEDEDNSIRPEDLDEQLVNQDTAEEDSFNASGQSAVEDQNTNDYLDKLNSKKKGKKDKPIPNGDKKKAPLLNIFLIALIAIIGLVLVITLISKLLGGNDDSEITISSSEFETAEQISVQKAKELIEESNSVDEIVGFEEGEEITFEGGEGFASENSTSNSPSGLVSFREEEVIVNSNGLVSYSNARFGASFEHPPEWTELTGFTAKETAENVSNVVMVGYPAESEKIENMRISMEGTPISISSKEYFSKTEGLMEQTFNKFSLIKKGETTANGGEAPYRIYQWIPTSEEEEHTYDKYKTKIKQYQVYLAGKEKVYVVTFTAEASVFDKNFDKYNQILTTLSLQR